MILKRLRSDIVSHYSWLIDNVKLVQKNNIIYAYIIYYNDVQFVK